MVHRKYECSMDLSPFKVLKAYTTKDMNGFDFSNFSYYIISDFNSYDKLIIVYNILKDLGYDINIDTNISDKDSYSLSAFFLDATNGVAKFFSDKYDLFISYHHRSGYVCELLSNVFIKYNRELNKEHESTDESLPWFETPIKMDFQDLYPNFYDFKVLPKVFPSTDLKKTYYKQLDKLKEERIKYKTNENSLSRIQGL